MIAFVFPGQGSQYVGMGKSVYERQKELFEEASDTLGFDISKLCFEGPEAELNRTENTQPALLTVSYALLKEVLSINLTPAYVSGHSLGEYTACLASEVFSFRDAIKIVRKRGELMQRAQPEGKGAMAAVLGLNEDTLREICDSISHFYVDLANLNCPGQIVVSGEAEAVAQVMEIAKERGAKKVIPLQVSIPSHCKLMIDAAEQFAQYLRDFNLNDPKIPVVTNVDGEEKTLADSVFEALMKQLYSPVRWQDCVKYMVSKGVDTFIEIGPGKVLSGLIKRIDGNVRMFNVDNLKDIEKLKEELK